LYLVECKPDGLLIGFLTSAPKKEIEHAGNKSELLKKLVKDRVESTGVVDDDPGSVQPPYLNEFSEIESSSIHKLKMLKHKTNLLIILCPRLEDWILDAAKEADVDPRVYGLPDDSIRLHKQINIQLEKFQKLLEALIERKSKRIEMLKKYLKS